jgi:7-cyano-7-deazaguanine synthase
VKELESAKRLAHHYDVSEHKIMKLDLGQIGGSTLTDLGTDVPENRDATTLGNDIPTTYVPARNTILLSMALSYAEVINAKAIFIGANALDYSGYPDCRPEFFSAFEEVARLGTKVGVEGNPIVIQCPLIGMTKAEIINEGARLEVPFHLTWSCYKGEEKACGRCDSCILRLKGFSEANIIDPIEYEEVR